jgi:hypothetical protein
MTAGAGRMRRSVTPSGNAPERLVKVDPREGTYGANPACFCMREGVRRDYESMPETEAVQRGYHLAECCTRLDREELAGGPA